MSRDAQFDKLSPAKQALYEIRSLKEKVAQLERAQHEPIAIVGFALRFPGGAQTPDDISDSKSFWNLLSSGAETITEIPASRWSLERFYDSDSETPGKMYSRHGSFLADPSLFDPHFFGISPREAVTMDPQQRLALEVAWEALENSGHNPTGAAEKNTGVFFALSNSDYARMVFNRPSEIDAYASTGNNLSVVSGRISYTLGLHGPSIVVDTACSGSLVAMHLAAQSLRAGECRAALAGGVNLILSPEININFSRAHMMSADGRCKTFDSRADGFVRGEGCAAVVLKRLSEALEDHDHIVAVLRGSAVNQDGRSGGLTAPNGKAQEEVIRHALDRAGVKPSEFDYLEAHGTGTELGDPIEAHAIANVFGPQRDRSLIVGSAKTNLGHLESAAGIAGLLKVILSLQHDEIPRHLNFQKMSPHIDWGSLEVEIPLQSRPWPHSTTHKRVAGVSSFGFSGTNAHLIVEEAPQLEKTTNNLERTLHLLTISARDEKALEQLRTEYLHLLTSTNSSIADICFTANSGRAQFENRLCAFGSTAVEIAEKLSAANSARTPDEPTANPVFLFPGQGSQFHGMGKQLYETQPVFRTALDRCAAILVNEGMPSLHEILWGEHHERIHETAKTQPAIFAIEWSLAQLWQSWGIQPSAILGHSVGEYVAACVAGVYTLEEGLKLIALRGRLMGALTGKGSMLAVMGQGNGDESKIRHAIHGLDISIAAENAPESFTLAGYQDAIHHAEEKLKSVGLRVERLNVSHAFHSAQMDAMREEFERAAAQLQPQEPRVRFISSVTGREISKDEINAAYWGRQIRDTVRFRHAIETLGALNEKVFLELGPGATLCGLARQTLTQENLTWLPALRKQKSDWEQALESLGKFWALGGQVDWPAFDAPYARYRVPLPTYPFQRQSYWLAASNETGATGTGAATSPALPSSQQNSDATWSAITEAASRQSQHGRLDLNVGLYPLRWAFLDRLTTSYIVDTFKRTHAFQHPGETHSVESLIEHCGFRPGFARLLTRWLKKLAAEKLLNQAGEKFTSPVPLSFESPASILEAANPVFDGDRIFLDYVVECGGALVPILKGQQSALETLFPNGSFDRAEDIYERAPVSAYFASVARAALEGFVRSRAGHPPPSPLRVLEIGAGTGSTASQLIPVLPRQNSTYDFTDVSDLFLDHARAKFANYDNVRYGLLDLERNPAEQNYPSGAFDVVVATNALHATRGLRETASRVRQLLAPGGLFILCESTHYLPWFDITTALIEGWQRFDDGLRHDHPLLRSATWLDLLKKAGFDRLDAFPQPDSPAEILGQHVILGFVDAAAANTAADPRQHEGNSSTQSKPTQSGPTATPHKKNGAHAEPEPQQHPLPALNIMPPAQRHETILALVQREIAALLHFDSLDRVERKRRLIDLGLDSLMAIELRNRLGRALRLEKPLSSTLIFDYPTPEALATHLEYDVLRSPRTNHQETALPRSVPQTHDLTALDTSRVDEIAELDDDEVEQLLLKKLESI